MVGLQSGDKGLDTSFTGSLIGRFGNRIVGNQIDMALKTPQVLGQFPGMVSLIV